MDENPVVKFICTQRVQYNEPLFSNTDFLFHIIQSVNKSKNKDERQPLRIDNFYKENCIPIIEMQYYSFSVRKCICLKRECKNWGANVC